MYLTKRASLFRLDDSTSLLINTLSGAVDVVDNELRSKVLQLGLGRRPALREQELAALRERGYLYADEGEERAALKSVHSACEKMARSRPLQFVVFPTYTCNLSCAYCFEPAEQRGRPEVMTEEQVAGAFAAMEQLRQRRERESTQVVLFGGEPLLPATEKTLGKILDQAGKRDWPVSVTTNGTFLAQFISLFCQFPGVVRGVQVTLDGPQSIHDARRHFRDGRGSYERIVEGVQACLGADVEVNLRVNLDSHNLPHLEGLVDLLTSLGWLGAKGFRCQVAPVTDHTGRMEYPPMMREDELVEPVLDLWKRRPEMLDGLDLQLFRVLHHLICVIEGRERQAVPRFHYCEADRGDMFCFGPDGLMYVCPESAGNRECSVGRFWPDYHLWPNALDRWENRSVLTLPECRDCTIATLCGGGCGYAALSQLGTPARGLCGSAPQVVEAYVRSLSRRMGSILERAPQREVVTQGPCQ